MFSPHAFSHTWRQLHVFASNSDCFVVLLTSVTIGQSNYFGFGFTTLNWKPFYLATLFVFFRLETHSQVLDEEPHHATNKKNRLVLCISLLCNRYDHTRLSADKFVNIIKPSSVYGGVLYLNVLAGLARHFSNSYGSYLQRSYVVLR